MRKRLLFHTPAKQIFPFDALFCLGLAIFDRKVSKEPKPKAVLCDDLELAVQCRVDGTLKFPFNKRSMWNFKARTMVLLN